MKTIVHNDNQVSLYLFDDSEVITVTDNRIVIGDPETLIIEDCNSNNVTIHENVSEPDDYIGWKYKFTGEWELNPDFIDEREPQ